MQEVENNESNLMIIKIQRLVINWVNKQKGINKKWNGYQIHTSFVPAIGTRVI